MDDFGQIYPINHEILWNSYMDYLLEELKISSKIRYSYGLLFEFLHNFPFTYIYDLDENRAEDGTYLRYGFFKKCNQNDMIFDGYGCSVLEMLAALAIRVENEYIGNPSDIDPSNFFMEMLKNLKFNKENNQNFRAYRVERALILWMSREFSSDGEGSIFPIKNPDCDQRELQIWDQLMCYLTENY